MLKFVTGEAALIVGKSLIITDVHLGIEKEYYDSGIKLPTQKEKIKKRIENLITETGAERLIILGDLKHRVPGISWQEQREIPEFINRFDGIINTELVLGNHDADIKGLLPNIKTHRGMMVENTYLTHGHLWPDKEFLKAEYVVVGHTHPQVEIKDRLGYSWRVPVWIKSSLSKKKLNERYGTLKSPKLVIMPSFNEFSGGVNMNRKLDGRYGPLVRISELRKAEVYLLDGTFLGELGKL